MRKKQLIPILVALFAWATAGSVSMPFLFVHPTASSSNSTDPALNPTSSLSSTSSTLVIHATSHPRPPAAAIEPLDVLLRRKAVPAANVTKSQPQPRNRLCYLDNEHVPGWYTPFILLHTICVFILPGLGIFVNHFRVRKKLCALSLTARAAHGELPLPMPLLRRPTHVIIVTGMANSNLRQERYRDAAGGSSQNRRPVKRKPQSKRLSRNAPPPQDDDPNEPPLDERPMIVSSREHNNNLRATASNASNVQQNPEFPLPQTSTLIFRRRLANILTTAACLFLLCWTPYIVSVFYYEIKGKRSRIATDLGLLIGECKVGVGNVKGAFCTR